MPAPKGHEPYNINGEGGRPKKYTKEFIEGEADAFEKWMKLKNSLWYEDFASERGYDPNLLSLWAKENQRFSGVYSKAQAWQKSLLIRGGLLNKFNASITKLVLANTVGWTDRVESKVSGDAHNPLAFILQNVNGTTKELISDESNDEQE
jgi:hypothetical protein